MLKKVTLPKNINFLKESEFDFVDDKTNNPLDGVKFTMNKSPIKGDEKNIYYIIDDGGLFVKIKWYGGGYLKRTFKRDRVMDLFKRGVWEPYFEPTKNINESENGDFDWIKDTTPKEIDNYYKVVLDFFDWSRKYKGYSYSANDVGVVEWYIPIVDFPYPFHDYYFYATPYWEGNGVMNVTAVDEQGHEIELHTIPLPKFKYEEQLKEWLTSEYPKIVYEEIKHFEDTRQYSGDTLTETKDLQWIKDVGTNRIDLVKKIKETLSNHGVEVEWERDHLGYNQEDTDGTRGEVFAKFFYDAGDRQFFIELIESENDLYGFYVYEYNEQYDTYYVNANYNSLGIPRESDETWRHVCWTVLNQMDAFPKKDKTGDLADYLKESDDFEWARNLETDPLSASPDVFFRSEDDMFYTLGELGHDIVDMDVETMEELVGGYGYLWSEKHGGWYHKGEVGDFTDINESNDFGWVRDYKDVFDKNKNYALYVGKINLDDMTLPPRENPNNKSIYIHKLNKQVKFILSLIHQLEDMGYDIRELDREIAIPSNQRVSWIYINGKESESGEPMSVEFDDIPPGDPTYDGQYEIVDNFKDFYFLITNEVIKESDNLDWIRDVKSQGFEKSKSYVVDVSNLMVDTPMSVSPTSEEYTKLTRADVLDKFKALGYNVDDISVADADYLYIEPNDEAGYWDDTVWVKQTHWVDYDMEHNTPDPTYNGKYEMIDVNDLMFLLDNKFISESKSITEVAGISFESREWAKIINNKILKNPNEKERLIIDGYDYPEAFKSFPIDYIVIDFYDKLTGYGQEHSGYDKDGNYVVLLYIQPKVISGTGGFNLRTVLNHEMKHAWDDYNRLSKGQPSIDKNKENRELYNKDFILMLSDKNVRGPIKEILKYYYYLSELEKTAYLENVYDGNLNYEKIIRDISSKDFEPFKERFDLDINWHLMNTAYDIPFLKKFKSPIEFIDYSSEELRSKAVDMIKKINKMKYIHNK